MAISTKVITMRQGNKADYQASKMLAGELAVINDTEELHFSPKSGKSIRVATEDDLKELENKIPSGGGTSFSGSAKDVTYDDSQTQLGATNVQEAIGKVSEQNVDRGTSLWAIVKKTAFVEALTDEELTKFKTAWGITDSEEEPDTPIEPDEPEVTLTSISATYEGGEVVVGTALTSLTGITVTGIYSDGTTANVTGYTLSGEVLEGENTITVSYNGLTATFIVSGYVETVGLYPLADGTVTHNALTVTVSNGRHIELENVASSKYSNAYINVTDLLNWNNEGYNVNAVKNGNAVYTIPSGSEVELSIYNVQDNTTASNISVGAAKATWYGFSTHFSVTKDEPIASITAETEQTIGCISVNGGIDVGTISFDINLTVDGVRWI